MELIGYNVTALHHPQWASLFFACKALLGRKSVLENKRMSQKWKIPIILLVFCIDKRKTEK